MYQFLSVCKIPSQEELHLALWGELLENCLQWDCFKNNFCLINNKKSLNLSDYSQTNSAFFLSKEKGKIFVHLYVFEIICICICEIIKSLIFFLLMRSSYLTFSFKPTSLVSHFLKSINSLETFERELKISMLRNHTHFRKKELSLYIIIV